MYAAALSVSIHIYKYILYLSAAVSRNAVASVRNEPETSITLKSIEVCRTKPAADCFVCVHDENSN